MHILVSVCAEGSCFEGRQLKLALALTQFPSCFTLGLFVIYAVFEMTCRFFAISKLTKIFREQSGEKKTLDTKCLWLTKRKVKLDKE